MLPLTVHKVIIDCEKEARWPRRVLRSCGEGKGHIKQALPVTGELPRDYLPFAGLSSLIGHRTGVYGARKP